ncbi:unnamed protein product [Ranitomeya imitator]|uniref:Uncharacterized protein n=1 Tax=Ranitomeya imitator TaxID=111125 RepID=A0ABN9KPX0_9NEOB|nr:unnamed protein product [Ranitomeya imitator]
MCPGRSRQGGTVGPPNVAVRSVSPGRCILPPPVWESAVLCADCQDIRLLLLLQSFEVYTELVRSDGSFTPSRDPGPSMSIGLTVRKYWSNILKLRTPYQKAESDVSVSKETRTIGSQTLESALVPCDACAIAQSSLKEVSDAIVGVCTSQNLPSSLIKIQEVLPPEGILSPSEMRYWASEEGKDLVRIGKHLSELTQLIQPLRNQCDAAKVENQRLQQNMAEYKNQLKLQKEELQRQVSVHEKKLQEKGQQNQDVVDRLERDKDELRKGSAVLEERVSILKDELILQHSTIRDLGHRYFGTFNTYLSPFHRRDVFRNS